MAALSGSWFPMRGAWRYLLIAVGSVALAMGVIGVFVPMWPTTPFLLLAAACYIRSSERLYRWLLEHRYLGTYVRDFVSGKGIPRRAKTVSLSVMWVTTLMSSAIMLSRFDANALAISYAVALTLIGGAVHYYIGYHIPTRAEDEQPDQSSRG